MSKREKRIEIDFLLDFKSDLRQEKIQEIHVTFLKSKLESQRKRNLLGKTATVLNFINFKTRFLVQGKRQKQTKWQTTLEIEKYVDKQR